MDNDTLSTPPLWAAFVCFIMTSLPQPAQAVIPEPDNVIHGTIVIGTNQVTAAHNKVVIEVQRLTGELVTSYRMGANPAFGDNYVVPIPLESAGAPLHADASIEGTELVVLVKEYELAPGTGHTVRYQSNYVVNARGQIVQMNFGSLSMPAGYPAWELAHGLPPGSGLLDTDGDGDSNHDEFVAGTHPVDPDDQLYLVIHSAFPEGEVQVQWLGRRAEGIGYEGKTRHYALEKSGDPVASTWDPLPGLEDVIGDDNILGGIESITNGPAFYRARVWLEP